MHLEWLLPIIFLIIWIVNSLLRGSEEDRSNNKSRTQAGGERTPSGRAPRRANSDIDRFLEEVNRRRRQNADRRPQSPTAERAAPPTVVPVPARPRVAARPPSSGPAPTTPTARMPPPPRKSDRIPVAEVIAVAEVVPAAPASSGAAPAARESTGLPPPATIAVTAPSPSLEAVLALLGSPDGQRTAILLTEILGKPLCHRHAVR